MTPDECRTALQDRLAEPAPGPIQTVTGLRQVGKTTLLLELAAAAKDRAVYAALDGSEGSVPGHFARLWDDADGAPPPRSPPCCCSTKCSTCTTGPRSGRAITTACAGAGRACTSSPPVRRRCALHAARARAWLAASSASRSPTGRRAPWWTRSACRRPRRWSTSFAAAPTQPLAIAGVLDGSWGKRALDVKLGRVAAHDLRGLGKFTQRYPAYRPLLLCSPEHVAAAQQIGIAAMGWQQFLLQGPPGGAP